MRKFQRFNLLQPHQEAGNINKQFYVLFRWVVVETILSVSYRRPTKLYAS